MIISDCTSQEWCVKNECLQGACHLRNVLLMLAINVIWILIWLVLMIDTKINNIWKEIPCKEIHCLTCYDILKYLNVVWA